MCNLTYELAFEIIGECTGRFEEAHPDIARQYPSSLIALFMWPEDPAEYCVAERTTDALVGVERQRLKLAILRLMRKDMHPVTPQIEEKYARLSAGYPRDL